MTENARIGLEFDRDEAVASFEQALDQMRRSVAELEAASERVDFDSASESAQRLRDNVREAAAAVVSMAERSAAELDLTERQAEQVAEAMATTKARADALGDTTGPAELRTQLDLVRSSSDRLNHSLAGAQSAGQAGSGAAAGGAGAAAGRFGAMTAQLSRLVRVLGAAGAAAGTFFATFRQTRGLIRDLEEMVGIDVDGWTQSFLTRLGELTGAFDRNELSAQDLENQWRFLQERGIEVEKTAEGIAQGFDQLQEQQDRAAAKAKEHANFLGELVEQMAGADPSELSRSMEDLATAYETAEKNGNDLINGPLGDAFRERVTDAARAIREFDDEIRSSLSGEELERYEKFREQILSLDAAVQQQAESQKEVARQQERIRESGDELASDVLPRLTEETEKNAETNERAAQAAKLYADAQREQVAAAQEQSTAADSEVERLQRQKTEIEQVVALGEAQGATMEAIAAASQVKGELFGIERQLEQATRDQEQAAFDLARANEEAALSFEERIEIAERTYGVELDALGNIVRSSDAAAEAGDRAARSSQRQGEAAQRLARDGESGASALEGLADESQRFADGTAEFERGAQRRGDAIDDIGSATEEAADNAKRLKEHLMEGNDELDKMNESYERSIELLGEIGDLMREIVRASASVADSGSEA